MDSLLWNGMGSRAGAGAGPDCKFEGTSSCCTQNLHRLSQSNLLGQPTSSSLLQNTTAPGLVLPGPPGVINMPITYFSFRFKPEPLLYMYSIVERAIDSEALHRILLILLIKSNQELNYFTHVLSLIIPICVHSIGIIELCTRHSRIWNLYRWLDQRCLGCSGACQGF